MAGVCYLRSERDDFIPHFVSVQGNEIYFYKSVIDIPNHIKMYSLTGCFLKNEADELRTESCKKTNRQYYPICIAVSPTKVFSFYLDDKLNSQKWISHLLKVMNYQNVFDYYKFERTLGKGQFGLVKLSTNLKTGQKVAIKQVKKKNMTHIEMF